MSEEQAKINPEIKIHPKQLAEFEQGNVRGWKDAMDALETCNFHGKYAEAIAQLQRIAKAEHEAAKKRLNEALENIPAPMGTFSKSGEKVAA